MSFVSEMWAFMRTRKKNRLLPVVITMMMFGVLIVLAESSAIAPFIYTLF